MNLVGAELRVRGVVQGVGFRYFAYRRASELQVKGSVKNEADGSVFVVAEGDRSAIEAYIDYLKAGPPSASVTDVGVKWTPYTGNFDSFEISVHY